MTSFLHVNIKLTLEHDLRNAEIVSAKIYLQSREIF